MSEPVLLLTCGILLFIAALLAHGYMRAQDRMWGALDAQRTAEKLANEWRTACQAEKVDKLKEAARANAAEAEIGRWIEAVRHSTHEMQNAAGDFRRAARS